MKRRFVVIVLVVAVAFIAISCATAPTPAPVAMADPSFPPWINDMPPEDVLWGIGVADNVQMQMRMTMADSRARQDIARQLNTVVQGMVTDYAREAGGISDAAVTQFQETISRQVTEATLQGVVRDEQWMAPDGRTLWMRVRMSKADASRAAANEIARAVDNEAAAFAQWRAMDALNRMDDQFARTPTTPEPVRD